MDVMGVISRTRARNLNICASCRRSLRSQYQSQISQTSIKHKHIARQGEQATPLTGFYAALLDSSFAKTKSGSAAVKIKRTTPTPTPTPTSKEKDEPIEEIEDTTPKISFSSRLAGPIARKAERDRQSTYISGILVPPKPSEPDNCCMSGCVNCVWDIYREDLEEWAMKAAEASARVKTGSIDAKRIVNEPSKGSGKGLAGGALSVDDDGGGSETNWQPPTGTKEEDLFGGIPVGIREFMKTEKMLKLKHAEEARVGG